ncbi:MAG: hypothetical protein QOF30_1897 [Acidimicrobiaceae bacterium]|nr:hypothetical protein [Acidimicrobiaceae bacterium]
MSGSLDRLYELLPAFHRLRDAQQGYPLRGLLEVINEQVNVVEDDIAALYENWFIETCQEWVVPYIGDLIGHRAVAAAGSAGDPTTPEGRLDNRILAPRREVAQTLGFRRRKGTLALLDDLAVSVSGWPARSVEFYTRLGWTQNVNHVHSRRARTADLRHPGPLHRVGGPFDRLAHTAGRRTIADVGVFVWRIRAYPLTHTPAYCLDPEVGPHCFTFSPLGHDTPLFTNPVADDDPGAHPDEINLPVPIRRAAFEKRLTNHPLTTQASDEYYGVDRSLVIWAPGWPAKDSPQPVPSSVIVPADLKDWRYRARRGQVGVDPERGRIVFPAGQFPRNGVWVTYRYGFSTEMGGGQYHHSSPAPAHATIYQVSKDHPGEQIFETVNAALAQWRHDQQALGTEPADANANADAKAAWQAEHARLQAAVIEIADSSVYRESLTVNLQAGENLQIRGADRTRPVIELLDTGTNRSEALRVWGKAGSRFSLDGLVVTGGPLQINGPDPGDEEWRHEGDLCDVRLRHLTLVPGWALNCDCDPLRPAEPSLELINSTAAVLVDHSIIGSISVVGDEVLTDPVEISVVDSIVDATAPAVSAVGAPDLPLAFARLSIVRSTVIGTVETDSITLAENSIFVGTVKVGRRQVGCMRFCSVAQPIRTPRRYHCQPDLATATATVATAAREAQRVTPIFTSLRYGTPGYAQLGPGCAPEVTGGADDEAEMGAFHDLFQPQRTANLRARLDEYTPAGMQAQIIFAD